MSTPTTREWANPTPAGLIALAVACFCFFAMLNGQVTAEASLLMGLWLLGGFLVQFVVALCDLKAGNLSGGNVFLYFSAYFMFVTGAEFILKYVCSLKGIALDGRIDGWAWLVLTLVTLLYTPAFFKASKCLLYIVLLLDIALPFITLRDFGLVNLTVISAWALLGAGIVGLYLSGALVLNGTFGKTVLPIGKPIIRN